MEINITIIIQAWIFILLFLLLSRFFFMPLEKSLKKRQKYIFKKQYSILSIYTNINQKTKYITNIKHKTFGNFDILYNIYKKYIQAKKKNTLKKLWHKSLLKNNENLINISIKLKILKNQFLLNKHNMSAMIVHKILKFYFIT